MPSVHACDTSQSALADQQKIHCDQLPSTGSLPTNKASPANEEGISCRARNFLPTSKACLDDQQEIPCRWRTGNEGERVAMENK